jgi:capsular polysaccharide biosynthesis protein
LELVRLVRAVRRYWWLAGLIAVAFLALGLLAGTGRTPQYEARAMVLVSPAGISSFAETSTDRFVQNQLVVFESQLLARQVEDTLDDIDAAELRRSTTFEQVVGTDIITVIAMSPSGERAQAIANGYASGYVTIIEEQSTRAREPELEILEQELAEARERLDEVTAEVQERLAPLVAAAGPDDAIPTIEQLAPALATDRDLLFDRVLELTEARNTLAREQAQLQAGNQVLQLADLPTSPGATVGPTVVAAALFAGLIFGGLAAVAMARLSGRVLDAGEVPDALGVPVAATVPRVAGVKDRSRLLVDPLPGELAPLVHELCVRAEASGSEHGLTVAVVGADDASGVTTIAAAMAGRFAYDGARVVLGDLDASHPELSALAGEHADGLSRLVRADSSGPTASPERSDQGGPYGPANGAGATLDVVPTPIDGMAFAGFGADPARIPRHRVEALLDAMSRVARIVVLDAGTMMDAASSIRLTELVDVVVLAVPLRRQRSSALAVVAQQLRSTEATVLPVLTPATASSSRRTSKRVQSVGVPSPPAPPPDPAPREPAPPPLPAR